MKTIKVKFYCNAGSTTETVDVDIEEINSADPFEMAFNEENQIQEEILKWLDNNQDCGWDIV